MAILKTFREYDRFTKGLLVVVVALLMLGFLIADTLRAGCSPDPMSQTIGESFGQKVTQRNYREAAGRWEVVAIIYGHAMNRYVERNSGASAPASKDSTPPAENFNPVPVLQTAVQAWHPCELIQENIARFRARALSMILQARQFGQPLPASMRAELERDFRYDTAMVFTQIKPELRGRMEWPIRDVLFRLGKAEAARRAGIIVTSREVDDYAATLGLPRNDFEQFCYRTLKAKPAEVREALREELLVIAGMSAALATPRPTEVEVLRHVRQTRDKIQLQILELDARDYADFTRSQLDLTKAEPELKKLYEAHKNVVGQKPRPRDPVHDRFLPRDPTEEVLGYKLPDRVRFEALQFNRADLEKLEPHARVRLASVQSDPSALTRLDERALRYYEQYRQEFDSPRDRPPIPLPQLRLNPDYLTVPPQPGAEPVQPGARGGLWVPPIPLLGLTAMLAAPAAEARPSAEPKGILPEAKAAAVKELVPDEKNPAGNNPAAVANSKDEPKSAISEPKPAVAGLATSTDTGVTRRSEWTQTLPKVHETFVLPWKQKLPTTEKPVDDQAAKAEEEFQRSYAAVKERVMLRLLAEDLLAEQIAEQTEPAYQRLRRAAGLMDASAELMELPSEATLDKLPPLGRALQQLHPLHGEVTPLWPELQEAWSDLDSRAPRRHTRRELRDLSVADAVWQEFRIRGRYFDTGRGLSRDDLKSAAQTFREETEFLRNLNSTELPGDQKGVGREDLVDLLFKTAKLVEAARKADPLGATAPPREPRALKIGQVSPPMRDAAGSVYFVRLLEAEPSRVPSFEEVRDQVAEDYVAQQAFEKLIGVQGGSEKGLAYRYAELLKTGSPPKNWPSDLPRPVGSVKTTGFFGQNQVVSIPLVVSEVIRELQNPSPRPPNPMERSSPAERLAQLLDAAVNQLATEVSQSEYPQRFAGQVAALPERALESVYARTAFTLGFRLALSASLAGHPTADSLPFVAVVPDEEYLQAFEPALGPTGRDPFGFGRDLNARTRELATELKMLGFKLLEENPTGVGVHPVRDTRKVYLYSVSAYDTPLAGRKPNRDEWVSELRSLGVQRLLLQQADPLRMAENFGWPEDKRTELIDKLREDFRKEQEEQQRRMQERFREMMRRQAKPQPGIPGLPGGGPGALSGEPFEP